MKYFLHDSSAIDDEKVAELFIKFGYEGVGLFYVILEKIAKQEKPIKTSVLKHQLKVGKKLEKIWSFLEEIELVSSNNGETFNKQLLNFSESYAIKKEKTREKVAQWREEQKLKENVTSYETVSNPPKVKVSKVNISKDIFEDSKIEVLEKPPVVSENKKPKDDNPDNKIYKRCVEFWLMEFRIGWTFDGVHGKHLKSIIRKFKKIFKDSEKEITEDLIVDSFKAMCIRLPEWYHDKDLPVINSKFNEVITQIKNGTKSNKQPVESQFRGK